MQEPKMDSTALEPYDPPRAKIAELRQEYMKIVVHGPEDHENYGLAHKALMQMVKLRTGLDRARLAKGASARKWIAEVNEEAKALQAEMDPIEQHLAEQKAIVDDHRKRLEQEAAERIERERKAKLDGRMAKLNATGILLLPSEVEPLTDEQYDSLLAQVTEQAAARDRAAAEAERLRMEREEQEAMEKAQREAEAEAQRQREAEELSRQRAENERLRRQQEAEAKAAQEKLEAERQAFAKRMADEKAKALEREKAERLQREEEERIAKAKREEEQRRMAEEREALEKAQLEFQREKREREEAERLERLEQAAKQRRAELEAAKKADEERRAAQAPDNEKVWAYVNAVRAIEIPKVYCTELIEKEVYGALSRIEESLPF